ncbi:HK97-gp10 family putative phage morphogenesis protein [Paenibacillus lautus]
MRNGVELIGVEQMLGSIRQKLNSGVDRLENQGLRAAGEIFADAQREKVAVSTVDHVHIRDDIKVSNVRRDMGERYVNIGPGIKTGWRAHFLEFGTRKTPAQPFIYPAFHENRERVAQLLASYMRGGMS